MVTRPPAEPPAPEPRGGRGQDKLREGFERKGSHLVARPQASEPQEGVGGAWTRLKHALFGRPLHSRELGQQRIPKIKALAVLSSDALSSVAYATEEILIVLVAAGAGAAWLSLPIALVIAALLGIVALSYRQTIFKYPQGGGTYTVTKDNLGEAPALVAGAALLTDYVMTVAVSISAGVASVTSMVPALAPKATWIALGAVLVLTCVNLRGVRESAAIFAVPTYMFLAAMAALLGWGAVHAVAALPAPAAAPAAIGAIGWFAVLRAFASGCTAMTGTEAISNGVPIFRDPPAANAARTLVAMAGILVTLFLGLTVLARRFAIVPHPGETVVSQLAHQVFGGGWIYAAVLASTAAILFLAANTSYADFPRLAHIMARDGYLPRAFEGRGARLGFSAGIAALGIMAAILLAAFRATTHMLIPLYAIGVFLAFTLSQASMARRWWTRREPGWGWGLAINGTGAALTATVAIVMLVTKFSRGAWLVALVVPLLAFGMRAVRRHFDLVAEQLRLAPGGPLQEPIEPAAVLLAVADLNRATTTALRLARSLRRPITAVHVAIEGDRTQELERRWREAYPDVPLVVLESPYRAMISPLIAYIEALRADRPGVPIMVVVPELMPRRWWEHLLHRQQANRLKFDLLFVPDVVVLGVPLHEAELPGR